MAIRNSATGWGWPARLLHWLVALLIVINSVIGVYMDTNRIEDYELIQTHKSWGFAIFTLALLRILWRLLNPQTPALPEVMPRWQRRASALTHLALYVLIVAVPISGWLMVSASPLQDMGVRNMVFGLFEMPDPFPTGDARLTARLVDVHYALWYALTAVVGLHAAAALHHHFVQRDRVLARMILGR